MTRPADTPTSGTDDGAVGACDAAASTGRAQLPEALRNWSARPGPAALLRAARARLEAGQRGDRLTLAVELDAQGRSDISQLLGLAWQASGAPVTTGQLRRAFRSHYGATLDEVVAACTGGPIVDVRMQKAAERAAQASAVEHGRESLLAAGVPANAVEAAITGRWLGPAGGRQQVCERVAAVWQQLPAPPGTLLASFANAVCDDPHALDKNTVVGRAVVRLLTVTHRDALSVELGQPADPGALGPHAWRAAWAAAGVTCDRVSSTVLVLNLPCPAPADVREPNTRSNRTGAHTDRTARLAALCAATAGEPLWLTGRVLNAGLSFPPGSLAGVTVRVCENPSVAEAAADMYGPDSPPLVCTYGRPSLAARALLSALAGAGARLLVTADRDSAGKGILSALLTEFPEAAEWLPDVHGTFEEGRLPALLADMDASLHRG